MIYSHLFTTISLQVFYTILLLPLPKLTNSFTLGCWKHDTTTIKTFLPRHYHNPSKLFAVHIEGYDEALQFIDQSAETGELSQALDDAVRFLEVNSYRIYPAKDPSHTDELWQKAQGSWKLMASTGSYKCRQFHPTPWFLPFPFAMIDGTHFGNGIGLDKHRIGLAFLHHAHFHAPHRRLTVTHPDLYVMGHKVSFPDFIRPAVLKVVEGERQILQNDDTRVTHPHTAPKTNIKNGDDNDNDDKKKQNKALEPQKEVPTFVIIAASEKVLIARGNQSGGLALWVRLPEDIRLVAYKEYPVTTTTTTEQDYHLLPQ